MTASANATRRVTQHIPSSSHKCNDDLEVIDGFGECAHFNNVKENITPRTDLVKTALCMDRCFDDLRHHWLTSCTKGLEAALADSVALWARHKMRWLAEKVKLLEKFDRFT